MQISIKDLNYYFDQRGALLDIHLELERGQFYGVVGPNGSGKTTLLKLMSSLLKAPKNNIWLNDKEINAYKTKERAKKVALVPQIFNADYAFSVAEIVGMGRYPYLEGLSDLKQEDHEAVHEALLMTDLLQYKLREVNTLSGGELQRVMIARALAQKTDILLLDEPLSHLDLHHQLGILKLIRKLCQELDITAVCVMHDLNHTIKYCDQSIMLSKSMVYAADITEKVLTQKNIHEVYDIQVEVIEIKGQKIILY